MDRHTFTTEAVKLIREGRMAEINQEQLIEEELEQLGRADKNELKSRVRQIIEHILKIDYVGQFANDQVLVCNKPGLIGSIMRQRAEIETLIEDSGSLQSGLRNLDLNKLHRQTLAALRAEYKGVYFPDTCPYTVDDLLNVEIK
jgi:Domain of unknown function DUF29